MRSTLDAFLYDIKELQVFIGSIDMVYGPLASHQDPTCLNIRRRLDYAAFIIALYAALEKFVEDLVWSYAELESRRNHYSELCEKLRSKHLKQSADLLSRSHLGEGRYTGVTEGDVVENLYACLSGKNPYKLNRHAVVYHDQNLRSNVVQAVFDSLGIENVNGQVCRIETMIDWFCNLEDNELSSKEKVPGTLVDLRLEDLVDRRNQVSHGGRDLPELLGIDEMQERLDFLKAYAHSLFNVLANAYIERYYIKSDVAISLGYPIEGPIKERTVVVVRKPPCRIFKGQPIVGVRDNHVGK